MSGKRAFFLDRDGTINFDRVYINDPSLMELIPGVSEAIQKIVEAGYIPIVVSNQSGIGRGLIDPDVLPEIHKKLNQLLIEAGAPEIAHFAYCPHHPEDGCECRKPGQKLLQEAKQQYDLRLDQSFFIGDSKVDILCGRRAGCQTSLVRTGKGSNVEALLKSDPDLLQEPPHYVAEDLLDAVNWALGRAPKFSGDSSSDIG